jgi:hypothetical protein
LGAHPVIGVRRALFRCGGAGFKSAAREARQDARHVVIFVMSVLLDQALAKVRELPEDEQELAARALLTFAQLAKQGVYELSPEERLAIAESRAQVRRGELATDAEIEAAYARFRA